MPAPLGTQREPCVGLIVVAIIAVLVAIAVPLFVGQLTKAEEATRNANIRAVRGQATVYILSIAKPGDGADGTTGDKAQHIIYDESGKLNQYIKVSTNVSSTGKIDTLNFEKGSNSDTDKCEKDGKGGYNVTVIINTQDTIVGDTEAAGE